MNEAELVLTEILGCRRAELYRDRRRRLGPLTGKAVSAVLKRRCRGESLFYILGKTEFMGFEFRVTPDCLVPRPETELLVEAVASCAPSRPACFTVLDIGTGSGCIAVSLAKMIPSARICATDISDAALSVAAENALRLGVSDRVSFLRCDLFPPEAFGPFDCIVANPPYIPAQEIEGLTCEVRSEPRIALDGGPDGLHFYRRIAETAHRYLKSSGMLAVEIGQGQSEAVLGIVNGSKKYRVKEVIMDYNGIERIITAVKDIHG